MADPMTRAEILRNAHTEAGVYPDRDELPTDPYKVNRDLDAVVQEYSRFSDSHYLTYRMALTSGISYYCLPDLKNLEKGGCQVLDGAGNLYPLGVTNVTAANRNRPNYLSQPAPPAQTANLVPNSLVLEGDEGFRLYPTPNYTIANGIILRGFGVINASSWPNPTDVCPLQPRNHQVIVYGLAERIAEDQGNDRKAARCRARWLSGKQDYEKELTEFTDKLRYGAGIPSGYVGWSGPLNMGNYFG